MTHCRLIDQRRGMHIFLVLVHDDSSLSAAAPCRPHREDASGPETPGYSTQNIFSLLQA